MCGLPLAGKTFFEKDGMVYCKEDYERLAADKCELCKQAITASTITALGAKWHPQCFKCKVITIIRIIALRFIQK